MGGGGDSENRVILESKQEKPSAGDNVIGISTPSASQQDPEEAAQIKGQCLKSNACQLKS